MVDKIYSFTSFCQGISSVLMNEVFLTAAYSPPAPSNDVILKKFFAIWDTGATNTVITERVVKDCGLKPIGMTKIYHVGGETTDTNVHFINIRLPNNVEVYNLRVTEGILQGQADVLIGMDIITKGDFAVTNFKGRTVFSFRSPSTERIDFTKQTSERKKPVNVPPNVGRNNPCPCGSGKKYKNCCLNKNK